MSERGSSQHNRSRMMTGGTRRILLIAALTVTSSAAGLKQKTSPATVVSGDLGRRLDARFTEAVDKGFNGAVSVRRNGHIVFRKAFGWTDREAGRSSTLNTVYELGSASKQFTAAAILMLESEGKLSVNDPISRFFPSARPDRAGVTIHQLLTHTGGCQESANSGATCDGQTTREQHFTKLLETPDVRPGGSGYAYSNAGYNLLAAVVEIASGRPYEDYLRDRIWRPAGMIDTGIIGRAWPIERMAVGYRAGKRWGYSFQNILREDTWPIPAPRGRFWCVMGYGGVVSSTISDMEAWLQALKIKSLLPPVQMDKLLTAYVPEAQGQPRSAWYGYGLSHSLRQPGRRLIGHNGAVIDIFASDTRRYIDDDVSVVVFSNAQAADQDALALVRTVHAEVFGARQ